MSRSLHKPGELVVSSSGDMVLQTLALSNPIAQVIASGAAKLQALAGDGSSTLILLLAELLRQAEVWVTAAAAAGSKHRRLLQYRRALMRLKQEQLEPLLLPLFRAHVVSVRTSDTQQLLALAQGIVRTIVAPTLGPAAPVEHLVELLTESILVPWCEAVDAATAHVAGAEPAAGSATVSPIKPGHKVTISGLRNAAHHNGVVAVVEAYRPKSQRWAVQLLGGRNRGLSLAVRAINLRLEISDNDTEDLQRRQRRGQNRQRGAVMSLKQHLSDIRRMGPMIVAVQGAGVSSSRVVDGVILCGSFHPHHQQHVGVAADSRGHGKNGGSVRFVLLGVALENTSTESGIRRTSLEIAQTHRNSVDNELEQWNSRRLRRLVVDLVHRCGVELIVSSRRVSEALAAVCSEVGVAAVQCVEKEEMQMLAHAAGAVVAAEIPYLTTDDGLEATNSSTGSDLSWSDNWGGGVVGTASSVKSETVGGKEFIHFRLLHPRPEVQPLARTLVLRGPGKALLALYAKLLDRCIAALDACCCWIPVSGSECDEVATGGGSANKAGQAKFAYNPLSSFVPTQAGNEDEMVRFGFGLLLFYSAVLLRVLTGFVCARILMPCTCYRATCSTQQEIFAVVPGGTVVELGLAAALERRTLLLSRRSGNNADSHEPLEAERAPAGLHGREEESLGLRSLHAGLIAVSRRLHANALGGGATVSRGGSTRTQHDRRIAIQFLKAAAEVARLGGSTALSPSVIREISGEGGTAAATEVQPVRGGFWSDLSTGCLLETANPESICEAGVLESAAGKWGVICVALEVAAQLLGVDAVLCVTHRPEGAAQKDNREAEQADLIGADAAAAVGRAGGDTFSGFTTGIDSDDSD